MVRLSLTSEFRAGEVSGILTMGFDFGFGFGSGVGLGVVLGVAGLGFGWDLGVAGGMSVSLVFLMVGLSSLQMRSDSAVSCGVGGVTMSWSLTQR